MVMKMRIILGEFQKLIYQKSLFIIAVCLIIANACVLVLKSGNSKYDTARYKKFFEQTRGMNTQQVCEYIDSQIEMSFGGVYNYPTSFLYTMKEQAHSVNDYDKYLAMIDSQQSSMAILFADKNSFSYRNIQKTPPAYKSVQEVVPTFDISQGIELALNSPISDAIGIFLVFFFTANIMLKDKECGIIRYFYPLKGGRAKYLGAKIAVSLSVALLIALVIFIENILIGQQIYGLGDLSRAIQSVSGFISCNINLSVGGYLILFLTFKALSYLCFCAFFILICCMCKSNISLYITSLAIITAQVSSYVLISKYSTLGIFRYWNIVNFTQTNEIFSDYRNVNFFGYPISLKISATAIMLGIIVVFSIISIVIFSKYHIRSYKRYKINLPQFKSKVHSRFYYTAYKSLIIRKGIVLMLLIAVITVMSCAMFRRVYNNTDIYYENYTTQLSSQSFEKAKEFIAEKKEHYEQVELKLQTELDKNEPNIFTIGVLSSEINDKEAVLMIQNRANDMEENDCNSSIFYDSGYVRILGIEDKLPNFAFAFVFCIYSALLISPQIVSERNTHRLIFSSQSGKRQYIHDNVIYTLLQAFFTVFILTVPYTSVLLKSYGVQSLDAPIQSVSAMAQFPLDISVWQTLLLAFVARLLLCCAISLAMLKISHISKNNFSATLINLAVFALPIFVAFLLIA